MLLEAQAHLVVGIPEVLIHADTMTYSAQASSALAAEAARLLGGRIDILGLWSR